MEITDDGLAALRGMKRLRQLTLNGETISGAGLRHLPHPPLEQLCLGTDVDDAALQQVGQFSTLKRLILFGETKITNGGRATIAHLPNLEGLDLTGTGIDDGAVDALARMEKLRTVYIKGTRITAAGVVRLKAARPKLAVWGKI